jgi:hypothetical protein
MVVADFVCEASDKIYLFVAIAHLMSRTSTWNTMLVVFVVSCFAVRRPQCQHSLP